MNSDREKWGTPHLWQDVLNEHQARPLHAMVGGGDQVYNDAVWKSSALQDWLNISNTEVLTPGAPASRTRAHDAVSRQPVLLGVRRRVPI